MKPIQRTAAIVSLLAACGTSAQGVPEGYTLVELEPLGGGIESFVSAINDRGEIVGRTEFGTGPIATQWDLGGAASLITISSGGSATDAVSINNEGSMLVECTGCDNQDLGVRLLDGTLLQLPTPAGAGLIRITPTITDAGQIAGSQTVRDATTDLDVISTVVWSLAPGPQMVPSISEVLRTTAPYIDLSRVIANNGAMIVASQGSTSNAEYTFIDTRTGMTASAPGGSDFQADVIALNDAGNYVAYENFGAIETNVLRSLDGGANEIRPIGCTGDCIPGIDAFLSTVAMNERDVVIGNSNIFVSIGDPPTSSTGFVWSKDTGTRALPNMIDDGSADGWSLIGSGGPADINDAGFIVGNGINPDGDPAAYVLIPRSPCAADTNRDGLVTPADYNAWILSFNNGCD